MSAFTDVRDEIAGKLTAAGIPATTSPRAPLPCVLVDGPDEDFNGAIGIGWWPAVYNVQIMTPPPGDTDAVAWMDDQLAAVLAVYPGSWRGFERRSVVHGGDVVPAYIVHVSTTVPNPNC